MKKKVEAKASMEKESRDLAGISGWIFWMTAFWLFASVSYVPLKHLGRALVSSEPDVLETAMAFGDIVIAHLPVIFAMFALYTARKLFGQFALGEVFSVENGISLTRMGDWLVASALAAILIPILTVASDEHHIWALSDSYMSVVMVFVGLAIRLIGRTFSIAAEIKADNDQIL